MQAQRPRRFWISITIAVLIALTLFWHGSSAPSRGYVKDLLHLSDPEYIFGNDDSRVSGYNPPPASVPGGHGADHDVEDEAAHITGGSPDSPAESTNAAAADEAKPIVIEHDEDAGTLPSEQPEGSDPKEETAPSAIDTSAPVEDAKYGDKLYFENDLAYQFPKIDMTRLRTMAPHQYRGPGHGTFATLFTGRNTSLQDPYFLATHEVVYRILWNPATRTSRHPITVFVGPFVSQEQRQTFEAVGAIVRDVTEIPFEPELSSNDPKPAHRFRDVFSKLEMWAQTDFSRIVYLDCDAFPLTNLDILMNKELYPEHWCAQSLLKETPWGMDALLDLCKYTFIAARDIGANPLKDFGVGTMINAGVMILQPSAGLHELLMNEFHDASNTALLNSGYPEQGLLSYVFRQNGAFPATLMGEEWNGDPSVRDNGHTLNVLHAKLWALKHEQAHWTDTMFADTWKDLSAFYESDAFVLQREKDGEGAKAFLGALNSTPEDLTGANNRLLAEAG